MYVVRKMLNDIYAEYIVLEVDVNDDPEIMEKRKDQNFA